MVNAKSRPYVSWVYRWLARFSVPNEPFAVFDKYVPSSARLCINNFSFLTPVSRKRSSTSTFQFTEHIGINLDREKPEVLFHKPSFMSYYRHATQIPFKMQVKCRATHVKQLIWLCPSYVAGFVLLQQRVCGAPRGLCGGLGTTLCL